MLTLSRLNTWCASKMHYDSDEEAPLTPRQGGCTLVGQQDSFRGYGHYAHAHLAVHSCQQKEASSALVEACYAYLDRKNSASQSVWLKAFESVQASVHRGVGIEQTCGRFNISPLDVAIAARDCFLARYLLKHGAMPNGMHCGKTRLYAACVLEDLPMVMLLQHWGASVHDANQPTNAPTTQHQVKLGAAHVVDEDAVPMHAAARGTSARLIDFLCRCGADIERRTAHGLTPLMLAVLNRRDTVVAALLAQGAAPNATGSRLKAGERRFFTVLDLARSIENPAIVARLQGAGGSLTMCS